MDSVAFATLQEPLKERYRADPGSALITLHARGDLDGDALSCSVDTGRALVRAGLHPATGGDGTLACSGDLLLQALVACAGVSLRAVATALGLEVTGQVRAEGDLDVRGTLGVDRDTPIGFGEVRLSFDLESDASEEELDALLAITERCCVVLQTLRTPARVTCSRRP